MLRDGTSPPPDGERTEEECQPEEPLEDPGAGSEGHASHRFGGVQRAGTPTRSLRGSTTAARSPSGPGVRAEHLAERERGRTGATTPTAWLQELVERSPEAVVAWREEAVRACESALFAYEEVRGDGESVAPQEDRG